MDAVCFACVHSGRLVDQDISTNSIRRDSLVEAVGVDEADRLANVILYMTPSLPTWQETYWPFVDGDFATFLKIASKHDFDGIADFATTILPDDTGDPDIDWQWDVLPDHPVTNMREGQYDISVYLFRRHDRLYTLWDAN